MDAMAEERLRLLGLASVLESLLKAADYTWPKLGLKLW